jgi:preprotein translocase subunit SecG
MTNRLVLWLAVAFVATCIALSVFEVQHQRTATAYMRQCIGQHYSQAKCVAMYRDGTRLDKNR